MVDRKGAAACFCLPDWLGELNEARKVDESGGPRSLSELSVVVRGDVSGTASVLEPMTIFRAARGGCRLSPSPGVLS